MMHTFRAEEGEDEKIGKELASLFDDRAIAKKFLEERKLFLWEAVSSESAKKLSTKLLYLNALDPKKEIHLYIHSPGGEVTSGFVILDTMELIGAPVYTYCMGMAASFGALLLSAGKKRYIYPRAKVMIHQPSLGGYIQGVSKDLEITTHEILKTKRLSAEILAENCKKPVESVLKDFERDYWMNAQEAISYGIVDEVVKKL